MKKILFFSLSLFSVIFAGISPYSTVRAVYQNSNPIPTEEIIDLTICLEREPVVGNPSDKDSREKYEEIIKRWADGIYELSNGGNYLGHIRFFTGGRFLTGCDVDWKKFDIHPNANVGAFNHGGSLNYSDYDHLIEVEKDDRRKRPYEAASDLLHESMHYIYGLYDEYGDAGINPHDDEVYISIDSPDGWLKLEKNNASLKKFKMLMEAYHVGALIKFQAFDYDIEDDGNPDASLTKIVGRIPQGVVSSVLGEEDVDVGDRANYDYIEKVDASLLEHGIYRIKIRNVHFQDEGVYPWGITEPLNASSTPNTVSWHSSAFDSKSSCNVEPQWQWWNFSTKFNVRKNSPQGMEYRQDDGTVMSAWDVLVRDPKNDVGIGVDENWPRYWFKSLINRAPSAEDHFLTTTFLNYDENTSWWPSSDATWRETLNCNALKNVTLPFMKVELVGKSESEYSAVTRKYLEIEWMDKPKMEIAVVLDASGSMLNNNKIERAKLAAKFVAGGFLSDDEKYDASNVRVGIYSFNSTKRTVYAPEWNPSLHSIYASIDNVSAGGQTALFDALEDAIESTDPSSMKMIYVISDGKDNASSVTKEQIIAKYREKDVAIHTFAYGSDADWELLRQMALETKGTFSEQDNDFFLKIGNRVVEVLANAYGKEQIASENVVSNSHSSNIYVEPHTSRLQIYGSFSSSSSSVPISVIDENGNVLNSTINVYSMGDKNYFIAEIFLNKDSDSGKYLKIKNNLNVQIDFRVVADEDKQHHAMDVEITEDFIWPMDGKFIASVRNASGLLTNVMYEGVIKGPNGFVEHFQLYDNGVNGDGVADDGIYTAFVPKLMKDGTYEWEIRASNLEKKARVTMKGTSLPNDKNKGMSLDTEPFTLYRNGQFVVHGCCSDPLENKVALLKPNDAVKAYMTSNDIDDYQIVGTESKKSYSLLVKAENLSSINKIMVYSPQNLLNPLYEIFFENAEDGKATVLLSAEYAKTGNILRVVGNNGADDNYTLYLYESDYASFAIGRFESLNDWHSNHTTLTLDTRYKNEGVRSLVTSAGWKVIESRDVSTADFVMLGDRMDIDIFVPSTSQNQYWIGNIELWVDIPSSNKHIQLGTQRQIQSYFNNWQTCTFEVTEEIKSIFSEPHPDARIQIILNTADSVWIDNLRFAGKLKENTVNKYEPVCPGDDGCSSMRPIQLSINNTIRLVPEGDLWFEVVDFPDDWTPAKLHLGISAEDGAELTGSLIFNEEVIPLSDWYNQKTVDFERNNRYLFKLHNLGGRPYRINAWVDGQIFNVASSKSKFTLPWVVNFL